MSLFDRISEFDPSLQYSVDATASNLGAPDVPGVVRYRVHPSGISYGLQGFRLVQARGALTADTGYILGGSAATYANGAVAAVNTGWGTATVAGTLAGIATASVSDTKWAWVQVWGLCTVTTAGTVVAGATMETAASGTVDDTSGTGTPIGFFAAARTNAGTVSAFLTIAPPRG